MTSAFNLPADQPWPVLYSFRRCPYAMRARLAIAISGERCELREVMLRSKPPELLAASPKATVPVLVLPGGQVIDQSLDIMRWALRQNDPGRWLAGKASAQQAMQALIDANDAAFKQHLDRYKYPNRYGQEHSGDVRQFGNAHRAEGALWLMELDGLLARHDWLFGPAASLADMAILPFARQYAHVDMAWFDAQPWPHLRAWLVRWETSELYQTVMEKHPPWQPGQPAPCMGWVRSSVFRAA